MTRWLALALGLAVAAAALYRLALGGGDASESPSASGEIDDASRVRLERVLEQADRGEEARP